MTITAQARRVEVNRGLLVGGAVVMAVGATIAMAGALATSIAAVGAARSWVRQWDEPPSELARRRLAQARSAATAGAQGWREHTQRLQAASNGTDTGADALADRR